MSGLWGASSMRCGLPRLVAQHPSSDDRNFALCAFQSFLLGQALFPGKNSLDQLTKVGATES